MLAMNAYISLDSSPHHSLIKPDCSHHTFFATRRVSVITEPQLINFGEVQLVWRASSEQSTKIRRVLACQ